MAKRSILLAVVAAACAFAALAVLDGGTLQRVGAQPPVAKVGADTFYPSADAYVDENFPAQNYGTSTWLVLGRSQSGLGTQVLVRFLTPRSIPPGATINSAELYVNNARGTGPDETIGVYNVTADWVESTVTWSNRPGHGRTPYDSVVVGTAAAWSHWDVTSAVQGWVNGTLDNNGLKLLCSSTDIYSRYFYSREGQLSPYLLVNWTAPTPTPTNTSTRTPTRTATATATATRPQCSDPYEPNNDAAHAWMLNAGESPLSYICCSAVAADVDWFKFHVEAGQTVDVWLSGLPADYNLCTYNPGQALLRCSSNAGTADEHVSFVAQQTGDYYAQVYGVQGACNSAQPYTLRIALTSPTLTPTATPTATRPQPTSTATPTATLPQCPDPYEPNNDAAHAWMLNAGESPRSYICCSAAAADVDWFKFHVEAGQTVDVWLVSLPADYNLCVYNPGQALLQCSSNAGTADEHVSFVAQQTGDYYAQVYGVQGACNSTQPYTLRIALTSPTLTPTATRPQPTSTATATATRPQPTNTATPTATRPQPTHTATPTATLAQCPDRYEPNDDLVGAWSLGSNEAVQSFICCLVGAVDEDYYVFTANAGDQIDLWLTSLPADYTLCLYSPTYAVLQCSSNAGTADEHISFVAQQPGHYYARVYGVQGACDSSRPYVLRIAVAGATPTLTGVATHTATRTATATSTRTATATRTPTRTLTPTRTATPGLPTFYSNLSLHVDDAAEGVIVNKVAGDSAGYASSTRVDVVAKLFGISGASNVSVILTVPGDLFGTPWSVYVRDSSGDPGVGAAYQNLGGGRYKVTTSLSSYPIGIFTWHRRQIVWRFMIPDSAVPQTLNLQAELQVPGFVPADPNGTATLRILETATTLALVNRTSLYAKYDESQVTSLLQRVYADVQGWPYSSAPTGLVYNVDMYDGLIRDWNNTTVNYASENTANVVPRLLMDLIKDWYDDATRYFMWYIPPGVVIPVPVEVPRFLMIAGDDRTIPFYRSPDPFTDEDDWNWTAAANPAIHATDHGFMFTDNPYADIYGDDWRLGNVELWTGRLVGETAADMRTLLDNGMTMQPPTGRAVMASVDGWELGYEPDDGRPGEITDAYNVRNLLVGKGYQVLNDSESPRTLDVMAPYPSNWITGFRNAANAGMDVFFIGGHNSPDGASIPGDGFTPDDTPSKYTRFGTDHPLVLITGCHGGLPVLASSGIPGGVSGNMVYDVVHEGARGYIGATGFSYGSPGDLHWCTWAERLMQIFFRKLTLPGGGNSMALGKALADAKNDYVFGIGADNSLDRKTVIEFQLYGAPWSVLLYPGGGSGTNASPAEERRDGASQAQAPETTPAGPVAQVSSQVYQQTFTVNVPAYDLAHESQGGVDYDIFSLPGGWTDLSPGYPRLPYLQGFTLTLPYSASVQNVELLSSDSQMIGNFDVPTVLVRNWDAGGATYTTTTAINSPYPATLVQYQDVGGSLVFSVFPVQHNPTTHQTWFYSRFEVRVTYEAPFAVGVTEVATDKSEYVPGENVQVTANIVNVGSASATVSATLTMEDLLGAIVCQSQGSAFDLAAGGSYAWHATCSVPSEGGFRARVTLWQAGNAVGGGSALLAVRGGEITAFTGPAGMTPGVLSTFRVTYANYRSQAVSAEFRLSIQDSEGTAMQELPSITLTVPAGGSQTAAFNWTATAEHAGWQLNAAAAVRVQGQTVGPQMLPFHVVGAALRVYLPIVLRSAR